MGPVARKLRAPSSVRIRSISGTITLEGHQLSIRDPRSAIEAGIAYLSEDRKAEGLALKMPVDANLTLANMEAVANPSASSIRNCIASRASIMSTS